MARWTRRLGFFTIVLAVIAGITAWILYDTLTANKLDQRAWVSVKIDIDGPFTYSLDNGAELPLKVTISNVGHEPAFNILPSVEFLAFVEADTKDAKKGITAIEQQKVICGKIPSHQVLEPGQLGQSLLPNESRTFPTFKVRWNATEFKDFMSRTTFDQNAFEIFVGGCFTYTLINGEGAYHQTGFIYEVSRKDYRTFRLTDGSTATDQIDLEPWADVGFGFFAN
jgi:hypothetical protein